MFATLSPLDARTFNGWLRATLWAGLIAGTIDIGSASVIYRVNPLIIMRAITGGALAQIPARRRLCLRRRRVFRDGVHRGAAVGACALATLHIRPVRAEHAGDAAVRSSRCAMYATTAQTVLIA